MGKPEGKRPLGRPRLRWEDNIKMDLREVGCDPGEWIDLADFFEELSVLHINIMTVNSAT